MSVSKSWTDNEITPKSVHKFFESIDTDALMHNIDCMIKQIDEENDQKK